MAKRFIDTGIWEKPWFRKLSPTMKSVWTFLCARCDHAGVWEIDVESIEFFVGAAVTLEAISETFGPRVKRISDTKLWLTGFVEFQYGDLKSTNNVHLSVINRLQKLGISGATQGLPSPWPGDQDKEKEQYTDKEMELDKEKEKPRARDDSVVREKKTLDEIRGCLPVFSVDVWKKKHDPVWVHEQIVAAIEYYQAEPGHEFWNSRKWVQVINAWLARSKRMGPKSSLDEEKLNRELEEMYQRRQRETP